MALTVLLLHMVIVVVTFLLSRCLATIGWIHIQACREGFMKYAVEMGSGAMIYTGRSTKEETGKRAWSRNNISRVSLR
jgi:hypothetical protein